MIFILIKVDTLWYGVKERFMSFKDNYNLEIKKYYFTFCYPVLFCAPGLIYKNIFSIFARLKV